jgi:MOSC domain-containing protein YiiM
MTQVGQGAVESVNVSGGIREVAHHDRVVATGIFKEPVAGRVALRGVNLEGDEQADRTVHGGPDRAVYAYAAEDLAWWEGELGRDVPAGSMGENLTTSGLDVTGAVVGERWRIGDVVLEVSAPRIPCFKLGIRMGDPRFQRRFARAERPGAYLRVAAEGTLGAGDPITVERRPEHGVTVALVSRAYFVDKGLARRLLDAPELGGGWRAWAEAQLA